MPSGYGSKSSPPRLALVPSLVFRQILALLLSAQFCVFSRDA
jgi:hypothetical protein